MSTRRALVSGSNRSGSTWVGKVLAAHHKVDTIIEPFNLNRINRFGKISYDYWYPRIEGEQSAGHNDLKRLLEYYLESNLLTFISQLPYRYEGHGMVNSTRKKWRRALRPYKILKDPTALFSVPWIVEQFGVRPVILIRHPAAYVLSIKEKGWWFDFDNFLKQTGFFNGPLMPLKDEVARFKENERDRTIVDNASLLWKVFYTQVSSYEDDQPGWHYIKHEDLSTDPFLHFERMFHYLDLDFNDRVQEYIHETTVGQEVGKHHRNSKENVNKWKNNLTTFERDTIYGITRSVSDRFYESF